MKQQGFSTVGDNRYSLVNVDEVDNKYFKCSLHENYGQAEVEDIITALKKVEKAYLK